MQALDRVADIETTLRRPLSSSRSPGIDGSVSSEHDWFYFVNGIEADRSAAEYRLHAGDIEWWDYRSWAKRMQQPVVVGAFPEPFRHGTTVVHGSARMRGAGSRTLIGRHPAASRWRQRHSSSSPGAASTPS